MFLKFPTQIPTSLIGDIKSLEEEKANAYSHLFGLLFFSIGSIFLLSFKEFESLLFLGTSIFCFGLIMVYLASTFYHFSFIKHKRRKLRILDHIAIYFLIAGTYTPFLLFYFKNNTGNIFLIILWTCVLVGTIFKLFYTHKFNFISAMAYLAMGWMVIFIIKPLIASVPNSILLWLSLGGLSYTLGVFFYLRESLRYNHFIWHIFVLCGSFSHFVAVSLI